MNEQEWLAATDPAPMLEFLRGKASERKLRLLGVAIARASWDRLQDERSRRAIEVAEQLADGVVMNASTLEAVVDAAWDVRDEMWDAGPETCDDRLWHAEAAGMTATVHRWSSEFNRPGPPDDYPFRIHSPTHCELVREVFGNPFRAAAFDSTWRTEAAVAIARGMYETRSFDAAPVLADALEDAGCSDARVLGHLRGGGPHVRGCWCVDGVLGHS